MAATQHLKAVASLGFISLNLLFWCFPLLLLSLIKLALGQRLVWLRTAMNGIYRTAVRLDHWWLTEVLGMDWELPDLHMDRNGVYIILCNHQSWSDIFLVQSAIARNGPIINFLCKRELAWVPVLGLIFWAYGFPMLKRRAGGGETERSRRQADHRRIAQACAAVAAEPAALLSFPEGTRCTPAKRAQAASPYAHLLPPKSGGFNAIHGALRDRGAAVLDLTLIYAEQANFWRFLGAGVGPVVVEAEWIEDRELADGRLGAWLAGRWRVKDARLAAMRPGSQGVSRSGAS